MVDTVLILSGGLDSAVLMYDLLEAGRTVRAVTFDYGQRHVKELHYAKALADRVGIRWDVVDLTTVGKLLGSSLIDRTTPVPHGHYSDDVMSSTVVPNRNMIMLAVAGGIAVAGGSTYVAVGIQGGPGSLYPDCRPPFIAKVGQALQLGNLGHGVPLVVLTPYLTWSKRQVVAQGHWLGVPFDLTWSCFEGGAVACGQCGSCRKRREAFMEEGLVDPIPYATHD